MVTIADYNGLKPAWCPGCGNFGILQALKKALVELEIAPRQVLLVSGIGQAGKLPHYAGGNIFNSLHGRPVPPACGAKIVNPGLKVIAVSGDGDAYGEGGNHFLHAVRRNHEITYLVHDNQLYALTKGQASPTSDTGYVTKTTLSGAANPVNPVLLALAAGAGFVARGFAGDIDHLAGLIKMAIQYKGFALIDILQPCVTFNHRNTFSWYRERVYKLGSDYDAADFAAAFNKAREWGEGIPVGVIFKKELLTFEDRIGLREIAPLVTLQPDKAGLAAVMDEFM